MHRMPKDSGWEGILKFLTDISWLGLNIYMEGTEANEGFVKEGV